MLYKAVIFDLDGTLLDTLEDLAHSMNNVLKRFGYPPHPIEAYRYHVGDGAAILTNRVLPDTHRNGETVNKLLAAYLEEYANHWNVYTRPYSGIPGLLRELNYRGIQLAVLSNKPDQFTRRCVSAYFEEIEFACVVGDRPGKKRKPDPEGALEVAHTLNVLPPECLYVGDTAPDLQPAVAAGMKPVGVTWGFRTRDELVQNGAEIILEQPSELLAFLPERTTTP